MQLNLENKNHREWIYKEIDRILDKWEKDKYIPLAVKVAKEHDKGFAYWHAAFREAHANFMYEFDYKN